MAPTLPQVFYIYTCLKCHKISVFRSQLPVDNQIYSDEGFLAKEFGQTHFECAGAVFHEVEIETWDEAELKVEYQEKMDAKLSGIIVDTLSGDAEENYKMLEDELETTVDVDEAFLDFQREVEISPDQVLR